MEIIKNILHKIYYLKPLFRLQTLFHSIFFNFYYLPFKQAIYLPIWIYKPHFVHLGGEIIVDIKNEDKKVKTGIIRLGFLCSRMYPNSGFTWTNRGRVIFKGKCCIGNASFIVTGPKGEIVFGDDFLNTAALKIVSQIGIKFGKHTRIGYEGFLMDTNFHPLYDRKNHKFKKAYGTINIGDNNWLGLQCYVMPGVKTEHHCIFGARSILTRGASYESYCVHGGNPLHIISRDVERIIGQDMVKEYLK